MTYDGNQMRLANALAPPGCTLDEALRAFAVLAGAAAAVSCRLGDEVDLGALLTEPQRKTWQALTSLLLEAADRMTPGLTEEDRARRVSYLSLVLKAAQAPIPPVEPGEMER